MTAPGAGRARWRPDRARAARLLGGCLALLLCATTTMVRAPEARADGDPAGTVLLSQRLYLPPDAHASAAEQARLRTAVQAAAEAGLPLRVAVIASGYDLGPVTSLWRRPQAYARFLGDELSPVARQPVLVVMPDGLGFAWAGHPSDATTRRLAGMRVRAGAAGLLAATATAVRTLTRSGGDPAAAPRDRGPGSVFLVDIAVGVAALALSVVAWLTWRRRRRPRPPRRTAARRRRVAGGRWAVGLAVLGCVTAGVTVALVALLHRAPPAAANRLAGIGTPYTWGAGVHRAPPVSLTGEDGRPVSLAGLRGRPVIVTFVDPLCRDLCPLAAHVLDAVDRDLPVARRPVILAVSVDVYGDSRATLREDDRRWDLVPQWRWAIGSRRALAAVWRRFHAGVSVATSTIAGTTFHSVSHNELAYLVDRSGDIRALYGWPYYPENIEAAVRRYGES